MRVAPVLVLVLQSAPGFLSCLGVGLKGRGRGGENSTNGRTLSPKPGSRSSGQPRAQLLPSPPFPLPLPLGKADGPVSKKVPVHSAVPGTVMWALEVAVERILKDLKFKKKKRWERRNPTLPPPTQVDRFLCTLLLDKDGGCFQNSVPTCQKGILSLTKFHSH